MNYFSVPTGGGGRLQPVLMRPTPQLSFKTWGGGGRGRGWGGVVPTGGQRGVWPGVRGASSQGWGGGGLGLGSPSWWNQSWFYNPF